jgi:hypothetical protein
MRKVLEQSFVAKRSTLRTRRQIASAFSGAGITKSHGKDCHFGFVVNDRPVYLKPIA